MNIRFASVVAVALSSLLPCAYALSAGDEFNLERVHSGSATAIRDAAKSVYQAGAADPQLLDAMAEALLTRINDTDKTNLDALAWVCKALGSTHNGRYYSALKLAAASKEAKLSKHCEKSLEQIGGAEGEQYTVGMAKSSPKKAAKSDGAASRPSGSAKAITALTVGMTQDEAYAIAGAPTSTGGHVTGKAFIPFNFKGADTYRVIAHYKGQGRVVFSKPNAYAGLQVMEIQVDPASTGFAQ